MDSAEAPRADAMPHSGRPPTFARVALNASVFLAVLVFGAVVGLWRDYYLPKAVGTKLEHFTAHKDDYDVLFIGSSAVRFQVNPHVFDNITRHLGTPTRSFNLGVDGAWGHEINVLLRRCLSLQPRRLRHVFLDTRDWFYLVPPATRYADREIWWHTPAETWSVCGSLLQSNQTRLKKLELVGVHWAHCAMRVWGVGSASQRMQEDWGLTNAPHDPYSDYVSMEGYAMFSPGDGFGQSVFTHAMRRNGLSPVGKTIEEEQKEFQKRMEWIPIKAVPVTYDFAEDVSLVHRVIAQNTRLTDLGLNAIYLLPPNVDDKKLFGAMYHQGYISNYWDFALPELYPSLYEIRYRHDFAHLNDRGATEFSRLLAERFVTEFGGKTHGEVKD